MPSLADLLRNDPWGAPPQTPLAKTVTDVGFDPSLGFAGAVQTYLSRLKKMQGGLAQDMLDTAADPNAEGIQRAANLLGGLGLKIANVPMALMPSAQELRDRGYQAGASPELQAVGGALGDMVNIPEPASVGTLLAGLGKAAVGAKGLAGAAAMAGKSAAVAPLGKGLGSLLADATPAEQAALKARLEAEAAQTGGQASSVSREQALNGLTGQDGLIAYHGSPHSFDKFDMSKIGTGEGAQAYGHGLYFAENEGVAKSYRPTFGIDDLHGIAKDLVSNGISHDAAETFKEWGESVAGKYKPGMFKRFLESVPRNNRFYDLYQKILPEADRIEEMVSRNGSMYQVHLDVKPHELLDWDKPLSEQPDVWAKISGESKLQSQQAMLADGDRLVSYAQKAGVPALVGVKVQSELRNGLPLEEAFAKVRGLGGSIQDAEKSAKWVSDVDKLKASIGQQDISLKGTIPGDWTGARIAKDVPGMKPDEIAQTLKSRGIKGIKYKDAGSRDGAGGTHNYVIFDDKLITILKKYGIPMTAGAGGAMLVAGQNMPPDIAAQLQQQ